MRTSMPALIACFAISLLAVGCASPEIKNINKRITSLDRLKKQRPNPTYVIEPPDTIQVNLLGETGVNVQAQVRQDGIVTLPHLGETKVAPMTTRELEKKLKKKFAKYYKEPRVRVTVTQYRSKHLYVYGEVRSPGPQPYTGFQSLTTAIGEAGGLTQRADYNEVKVVRGDPEDPEIYWADVNKLIYQGQSRQNVSLAPSDVVYVRPSALAWVGYRIQEVMFPFQNLFSGLRTYDTARDVFESGNTGGGF